MSNRHQIDAGQATSRTGDKNAAPGPRSALSAHPAVWICAVIAVLMLLAGSVQWLAGNYDRAKAGKQSSIQPEFMDLAWPMLIPKGWDPLRHYRKLPLAALDDSDPKARDLLRQMRETWDNAPTNSELDGARVQIYGYVVPLEANKGALKEFLLVPYAGACIHTPPPPANQIIHVMLDTAIENVRTMDTVRVSGSLHTARSDSVMGVSGYRLQAVQVEKREVRGW